MKTSLVCSRNAGSRLARKRDRELTWHERRTRVLSPRSTRLSRSASQSCGEVDICFYGNAISLSEIVKKPEVLSFGHLSYDLLCNR